MFLRVLLLRGEYLMKDYDENFLKEVYKVLKSEGGYVNDVSDSGGETKYGICKRSYPKCDIKNLTKYDAIEIYYRDFWEKNKIGKLPLSIRGAVFSAGINMGMRRALRLLQTLVRVSADGVIGKKTLFNILHYDGNLKKGFLNMWEDYYERLCVRFPKNKKFLNGWLNRVAEYRG
jgi:lysozyme family protein